MIWAAAGLLILLVSACGPHTEDDMSLGTHNMPTTGKPNTMSNEAMPSRNPNCSPEALQTMPPEHRLACEQGR
jgi:hypothetical protein